MIHVRARDHQHALPLRRHHFRYGVPQLFQQRVPIRPQYHRHKSKIRRRKPLQEGNLHLERMFALVRHRVLAQTRASLHRFRGQLGINCRIPQGNSPASLQQYRHRFAPRIMPRPQQNAARGNVQQRKYRPRHMPRIHVPRMRHRAPARHNTRRTRCRRVISNLTHKFLRFGWVKSSSNCRRANHFVAPILHRLFSRVRCC